MFSNVHTRRPLLLAAITVSALAATAPAQAEAATCSGAKATDASPAKLRSALLCVINHKRAAEGLGALKADKKLQKAASNHARDMVRRDYFAHQRPGGPDLTERLDRVGWNGSHWGESIAYGCGSSGSPKATLEAWLNSAPHRAILLSGTYKLGGLGLGQEAPCGRDGATWVLNVGRK